MQVKNIGFTGVFRIIFKPLVDEFPCFGALCYSLREKVVCSLFGLDKECAYVPWLSCRDTDIHNINASCYYSKVLLVVR